MLGLRNRLNVRRHMSLSLLLFQKVRTKLIWTKTVTEVADCRMGSAAGGGLSERCPYQTVIVIFNVMTIAAGSLLEDTT